jgi:hypothetical protein
VKWRKTVTNFSNLSLVSNKCKEKPHILFNILAALMKLIYMDEINHIQSDTKKNMINPKSPDPYRSLNFKISSCINSKIFVVFLLKNYSQNGIMHSIKEVNK